MNPVRSMRLAAVHNLEPLFGVSPQHLATGSRAVCRAIRSHPYPLPKALSRHPVEHVDLGRIEPNIDRIVRLQVGQTVIISITAGPDELVTEANVDYEIVTEWFSDIDRGRHTPCDRNWRLADCLRADAKRNLPVRRTVEHVCATYPRQ